jgi:hypothetical protein
MAKATSGSFRTPRTCGTSCELGQAGDLAGLATALKVDDKIGESVVATLMTRLGWRYLTAKELAVLVHKQFERGRGGFSVSHAFDAGLVEEASDDQLYQLCRSLVVRLARLRQREGRPARSRGRTVDRYVELVAETLAALLRPGPRYQDTSVPHCYA